MVAKIIRHKFQSAVADGADTTLVRPSAWNGDAHDLRLGGRMVTAATDTIVTTDELSLIKYNRSSAITASIAAPDANNFVNGWLTFLRNIGAGLVTITPPGPVSIAASPMPTTNRGVASRAVTSAELPSVSITTASSDRWPGPPTAGHAGCRSGSPNGR